MHRKTRICWALALAHLLLLGRAAPAGAYPYGQDPLIDTPMYAEPGYTQDLRQEWYFDQAVIDLWVRSLDRREVELRRRICDMLVEAHARGVKETAKLAPRLIALVQEEGLDPLVRSAAVRALAVTADKSASAALLRVLPASAVDDVLLIDAALARWGCAEAAEPWRARAGDATQADVLRRSAVRALGVFRDQESAPLLRQIVSQRREPVSLRLAAAEALGAVATTGLEPLADLLAPPAPVNAATPVEPEGVIVEQIIAAHLLARHDSLPAKVILGRLARVAEPAVARLAGRRMAALEPVAAASELAPLYVKSGDIALRDIAVDLLTAQRRAESVTLLTPLLDDPAPQLRIRVRDWMIALLADATLRPAAVEAAGRMLSGRGWRGIEQAALILGKAKEVKAGDRLIELFTHERPEVRLAACTAVRWIADPATLPRVLERSKQLVEAQKSIVRKYRDDAPPKLGDDDPRMPLPFGCMDNELAQLNQMMGQMRYGEAEAHLRTFVAIPPETVAAPGGEARAAAIWSLGLLLEGKLDEQLAKKLAERILDQPKDPPVPPLESAGVWHTAALTIGRMKAKSQLPVLRRFYSDSTGAVTGWTGACRWAIIEITGQDLPMPPAMVARNTAAGWLLEPLPKP